jgi:hypothetical protein
MSTLLAKTRRHLPNGRRSRGQLLIEFAAVSIVFLLLVFGTLDFGRAIYLNSQMHAGIRDALREGKRANSSYSTSALRNRFYRTLDPESNAEKDRPGLEDTTVTITCGGGCPSGATLSMVAELEFSAIVQTFLGIDPFTLRAEGSVVRE